MVFLVIVILIALPVTALVINRERVRVLWLEAQNVVRQSSLMTPEEIAEEEEEAREAESTKALARLWFEAGVIAGEAGAVDDGDEGLRAAFEREWNQTDES